MSYSPLIIANKIVRLKKNNLTIMELLKLQYISHGYSLAIFDKPLFNGVVQAWPYGPVIPEVYNAFRNPQGINIIEPIPTQEIVEIDEDLSSIIAGIVDLYKEKDGWDLSVLTHENNSPWTQTVATGGFYSEIPNSLTKEYYKHLIEK